MKISQVSVVLIISIYVVQAHNYNDYEMKLSSDGKAVYDDFLRLNPHAKYIFDDLLRAPYEDDQQDASLQDDLTDSQWRSFLKKIERAKSKVLYNQPKQLQLTRNPEVPYEIDTAEFPNLQLSLRQNEVAPQNQLWGEHKVSGGSAETGPWVDYALLGAHTQDSNGTSQYVTNIEDIKNLGSNLHDKVKMDNLPAYCDPPNPCPLYYDRKTLLSPCDEYVEDSLEYNKAWIISKMNSGQCSCDTEHMNQCYIDVRDIDSYQTNLDKKAHMSQVYPHNPYLYGQKRGQLVAKKRVKRWNSYPRSFYNPYLKGKPQRTNVKT